MAISAIARLWVKVYRKCVFIFGPGYRVYWMRLAGEIVILLAGGDKSTQQSDIALALMLARTLKEK
jgi:putative addiction module killer protein